MSRSLAQLSLLSISTALLMAIMAPSSARADSCGSVDVSLLQNCQVLKEQTCTEKCEPVSLVQVCTTMCNGGCTETATTSCTAGCETDCLNVCTPDPTAYDCKTECTDHCEASCSGHCETSVDSASC